MQRQPSRRAEAVGLPQARGRMVAGRVLTHHRWLPHGVRWSVGWVCPKGSRPQAGSVSERRPQAGSVSERGQTPIGHLPASCELPICLRADVRLGSGPFRTRCPLGVCAPTRCPLAVCSPTRCPLAVWPLSDTQPAWDLDKPSPLEATHHTTPKISPVQQPLETTLAAFGHATRAGSALRHATR